MKIIKLIDNNVVVYAENNLILNENGSYGSGWYDARYTTTNCVLEIVSELPKIYANNAYSYDGTWVVVDQSLLDEVIIRMREQMAIANKQQATLLLQQTDWTCTVDINNPEYSNPYLLNQNEFLVYRSQVRAIAVNPPKTEVIFPETPNEQWSTT